ncbi:MAG: lysophospholipase [Candidatus Dormiibacterota bacterium]
MIQGEGNPAAGVLEDAFTGVRGVRIQHRTWWPAGAPRGIVVIAHGFAEHSGRYSAVAERLTAEGCAVRAPDHRGHGHSEGKRTSVVRFDDYVDDLLTVITHAREEWPSVPMILLGHSMGGLVALALAVRVDAPIDALVVSAPAACPGDVSRIKLAVGRVLSRVAPNAPVLRLPLNKISRDRVVVDAYNHDPFVFRAPIRARLGAEMIATMQRVDAALPALRVPLLVMQGTSDGLVDPGCGPHVYERAGSPDKTLKMYDGLWHEIFNEPERDHVLDDLVTWVRGHVVRVD